MGIDEDLFVCLYVFDFNSDYYRKNPDGAVKAFKKAFQNNDKVLFIIKTLNSHQHINQLQKLKIEIRNDNRIVMVDNELSEEKLNELYNLSDLYISLHRSEGSGLTIMEMLMLGKPVVVTNFSGNLDFCKKEFTSLVNYNIVNIDKESYYNTLLNGKIGVWAEPDIIDAANKIKHIYDNYETGNGLLAQQFIEDKYNKEQLCDFIKNRVDNFSSELPTD